MAADADIETRDLRDYLRVLRRRKFPLAVAALAVMGAALLGSVIQTPVYATSAEVLRQVNASTSIFQNGTAVNVDPTRAIQTEIRVIESQPIRDAAQAKLGYKAKIKAQSIGATDIIGVQAEDTSPRRAVDIANTFANAYIEYRRTQAVDFVLSQVTEVGKKINELKKQIDASAAGPVKDSLVEQQTLFQNRLDQLQVDASLQTGGAELVNGAELPESPVRPRTARNAAIGLILGVLFGAGVAFLLDYLDDSIKNKEEFERAVPSLPVLAMIPSVGGWKAKDEAKVVSILEPNSVAAEAYRTLRTSIQFLGVDRPLRSLHVTSANAEEGKTTTLANLGVALARAGARVVIVCSDLRRPRIHEMFGLTNKVGFTSVLLGEVSLAQALQKVPGVERLYLLASGPFPPNPSELLQSRRAAEVFEHLKSDGNFLLIDSPPILPVTDGLVLAKRVDGTVMVCAASRTGRKEFARAVEMLQQVDAPVIGAVLNGVTEESGYGYKYRYYTPDQPAGTNGSASTNGRNGSRAKSKRRSKRT